MPLCSFTLCNSMIYVEGFPVVFDGIVDLYVF